MSASPQEVLSAVAAHFMVPRDAWVGSSSRARRNVIIRKCARAVAAAVGCDRAQFATAILLAEATVADLASSGAYEHSMHVADVLKRLGRAS